MPREIVTNILKRDIEKAANLDKVWQFSANGNVEAYVGGKPDIMDLLSGIRKRNPNLVALDPDEPYTYVAKGELESQIRHNLLEAEEKKAKREGFPSLMDKAAHELPWKKHDNEYKIFICDLNAPVAQKKILNAMLFTGAIIASKKDSADYKGRSGDSYNSYTANENLGELIAKHRDGQGNIPPSTDKTAEIIEIGSKGLDHPSHPSGEMAKVISLGRKETRPIITK